MSPDAFPSSEAFEQINAALSASEADRQDAIKTGDAVFAFTLKNKAGETESWHIDLKKEGKVGKGLGEKPTGEELFYFKGRLMQNGQSLSGRSAIPNSEWFRAK